MNYVIMDVMSSGSKNIGQQSERRVTQLPETLTFQIQRKFSHITGSEIYHN